MTIPTKKLRIESLAVGDELLDGRVADRNTQDLGVALAQHGLELAAAHVVPDHRATIVAAVKEAAARADILVTSGGLGPTTDDITAECVAEAAGTGLRLDEPSLARMVARFESRGMTMPDNNRRQAMLPAASTTLDNEQGTAPGFVTPVGTAEVWSFPGVPREYGHLLHDRFLPKLRERLHAGKRSALVRRTLRTLGMPESAVGERLAALEREHRDVRVQYRLLFPEILVTLVVDGDDVSACEQRADQLLARARADIGPAVWGVGDAPLEARALELLGGRGETLATAESCTGGLVGKRLTDVPGSSSVVVGGVIAYANEVKTALLGVSPALLQAHGAVSEEVARAMAEGARARLSATWAVSTTGVAGPGGGTDEKPVGLVWFALAGPLGTTAVKKRFPDWGRERIREMAAAQALRLVLEGST